MSQVHLHLVITHLPVFGTFIGMLVLLYGKWYKSPDTLAASYYIFILSALGAGIAYLTGEGAEESVEGMAGVAESLIESHEESASIALAALIAVGVTSLAGLLWRMKNTALFSNAVILMSLIAFGLVARTAYLGGQIRHTEIRSGAIAPQPAEQGESQDDD